MLEKEAKERAKDYTDNAKRQVAYECGFLDGAELGCKKANEELEEIKKLKELSKKYKGKRCSQYCSVWNSEDRDCEIMGSYHLSPSRCRWFLMQELRSEETK